MNTPQERVIKKMIDNIVETNRPVFERPASGAAAAPAQVTSGHATAASAATAPSSSSTPMASPEDGSIITRKLDYGFNSLRTENADLRKQLEELSGSLKLLRNDIDTIRQAVLRGGNPQLSPQRDAPTQPMTSSSGHPSGAGAPQYRKTAADEAYEQQSGQPAHEEPSASSQARGFQKKEDAGAQIDINKVFYYGKK